ncbi:MAG: hypothetical protein NPIRA04_03250 [Nitrospirales bacterium]|nr:MAG: hypothetical protein NPIRA04_03250 [Nitrospirales bacterium]
MDTLYTSDTELLAPLPDTVVLSRNDDLEKTVTSLDLLYEAHFSQWAHKDRERWFKRETRYADEEQGQPSFPVIMRTVRRNPNPRFVTIPDGRRVIRLDPRRVLTLCGTREVMTFEDAIAQRGPRGHKQQCPSCYGWHLQKGEPHLSQQQPTGPSYEPRIRCPKCTADAEASYFLDEREIVCRLCGHRVEEPLPVLSDEEEAQNAWAMECAMVIESPDPIEEEADQSWDGDFPDESVQDEIGHDDRMADHDADHVPVSWMADVDLETLDAQDLHELGDALHEPAFHLFTARSSLRQGLINSALVEADDPESRMMVWAAAGRLLSESARRLDCDEGYTLAAWLEQLDPDDLSLLAGDCDAVHPWLAHPKADMFEPTDRLLRPLQHRILHAYQRFRKPDAAIRYLSRDFRLSPVAIRHLVTTPADSQPVTSGTQAA